MKNKNLFTSLILLFITASVFGQLRDSQYKFSINIPANWSQKSYMDGTDKVYDFYSPDENAAIQLRAFKSMDGLTLDLLTQVYEQNYLPSGASKESLEDKTSSNGIPGKQGIYVTNYNGYRVGMSSFFTIQNGYGYVLTAIIPETMFEQKSNEVRKITQSFLIDGFQKKKMPSGLDGKKNFNTAFKINKIELCEQTNKANEAINPTTQFTPNSREINAVIHYQGKTSETFYAIWIYSSQNHEITRDAFNFTANGGVAIVSLSKPNNGWPEGSYEVRFEMNGKTLRSIPFTVVAQQNNGGDQNSIAGRYNFISRSDGQRLVRYHYIDINANGTYTEKYEPKDSPGYEGGNSGTWRLNGNTLTLTHKGGGVTDTYEVNGNELYRSTGMGLTFKFRKNTR